jgi:hypothetical protein
MNSSFTDTGEVECFARRCCCVVTEDARLLLGVVVAEENEEDEVEEEDDKEESVWGKSSLVSSTVHCRMATEAAGAEDVGRRDTLLFVAPMGPTAVVPTAFLS